MCFASTKKRPKLNSKLFISKAACNTPEIERIAALSTINIISQYSVHPLPQSFINMASDLNTIHLYLTGMSDYLHDNYDAMLITIVNFLTPRFEALFCQIIQLEPYMAPTLSISNMQCLQILLNDIKIQASLISYRLKKQSTAKIDHLSRQLAAEKSVRFPNHSLINSIEDEIQTQLNLTTPASIIGNGDDPSRISMALKSKFNVPTSLIKDDTGQHFPTSEARSNHIVDFFRSIYSNPYTSDLNINDLFELNNINVRPNISHDEANELLHPFTSEEITKCIESLNISSATGPDKIPKCFAQKNS